MKKIAFVFIAISGITAALAFSTQMKESFVPTRAAVSTELSGSGTELDPYLIQSDSDMAAFKQGLKDEKDSETSKVFEGIYFKLTSDVNLTLSETSDGEGQFRGVFDGDNHEVNLIQDCDSSTEKLAFINVNYNIIKNVIIKSSTGLSVSRDASGITNYARAGTVDNCVNYADISSTGGYIAGIANVASCQITNCVNYGLINDSKHQASNGGASYVGGVVGQAQKGSYVYNCKNFGSVRSIRGFGGVIGGLPNDGTDTSSQANYVRISNCENYGYVDGRTNYLSTDNYPGCVGGITAYISAYTIMENCSNYGTVSSYSRGGGGFSPVGGLCGHTSGAHTIIRNCVNAANVTATNLVGGIFGWDGGKAYATVENCIQAGNVVADGLGNGNVQGDGNCGGAFGVLDKTATLTNISLLGTATATGSKTTYVNIKVGNDKAAQNLNGIIDYHEVNDAARSLVGEVRRFECLDASSSLYATISALIDSVNNDSTSFDALSSIQFIDKCGVEGSNYLATAQYISDYCYSLNSLASLHIIGEKLANPVSLVIVITSCVVILAISIFIIKRKRVA